MIAHCCMRAFSQYCLILSLYTIYQLLLINLSINLANDSQFKIHLYKNSEHCVLCACVRLDFPFHIAQKVGKLLGVGAGFRVKKDQNQESVVESRRTENTEYYCHCSLPSSQLCLVTPFSGYTWVQLLTYKVCVQWQKDECQDHVRKREVPICNQLWRMREE